MNNFKRRLVMVMAGLIWLRGMLGIVGYLFNIKWLYHFWGPAPVSASTTVLMIFIGAGLYLLADLHRTGGKK